MSTTCKFCVKFAGNAPAGGSEAWDRILFASTNFVVVPTVGSIVPGWLLVVPRKHFLCVGTMADALVHEMVELRRVAANSLCTQFGPVASFEHGPAEPSMSVGCGVDHAHLHLVATSVHLLDGARQIARQPLSWTPVQGLQATAGYHQRKLSYLYAELPNGESWVGTGPRIESQLFRRVIAAASGRTDAFDWKCHSFEPNVRQTIHAVESWLSSQRV